MRICALASSLSSTTSSKICLVYERYTVFGIIYDHYFITDNAWIFEFKGDDIVDCTVRIHNDMRGPRTVERCFQKTPQVVYRMQRLCGARAFSFCLRNCEHVARYISDGHWYSAQAAQQHFMWQACINHVVGEFRSKMNAMPLELKVLYPAEPAFLSFEGLHPSCEHQKDDTFNILLLGTSRKGKRKIVDLFFNQSSSDDVADLASATVEVTTGVGTIGGYQQGICIIDAVGFHENLTAGLCVAIQASDVPHVKHADRVLVICDNNVNDANVDHIRGLLHSFRFNDFPLNFTFVYYRDDCNTGGRQHKESSHLYERLRGPECFMREPGESSLVKVLFEEHVSVEYKFAEFQPSRIMRMRRHDSCNAQSGFSLCIDVYFPSMAAYEDIMDDLYALLDATFVPTSGHFLSHDMRIPLRDSWVDFF